MMPRRPYRLLLGAILVALVIVIICVLLLSDRRQRAWHNIPPFADDQPGQLHLRITGDHHNGIEAYFHNQGDLDDFELLNPPANDQTPLAFGDTILTPPNGVCGTFAVIYGSNAEKLTAFGWQPGKLKVAAYVLPTELHRMRAEWITSRLLRVEGNKQDSTLQVFIIEFVPKGDQPWKILFQQP